LTVLPSIIDHMKRLRNLTLAKFNERCFFKDRVSVVLSKEWCIII
jgi:hypothetical protein